MKKILFVLISNIFLLASCVQNTENKSRQFQKEFEIRTLSKDSEEIGFKVRCYYNFDQDSVKMFNNKGYFGDKKDSVDILLEPIIRAATRHVILNYSAKELYTKDINYVQEAFYQRSKILLQAYDFKDLAKIRVNQFLFLGDVVYPNFVKDIDEQGLLAELALLRSSSPKERMYAIEKLVDNGSETAYSLILEHWQKEKDQKVKNFIVKKLSNIK